MPVGASQSQKHSARCFLFCYKKGLVLNLIAAVCEIILQCDICRLRPMTMDDPAYTFLAFSGIPSVSFHFISPDVSLCAS